MLTAVEPRFEISQSACAARRKLAAEGELLVHNIYVTADLGMKGWISTARNYLSVELGDTMPPKRNGKWTRSGLFPATVFWTLWT